MSSKSKSSYTSKGERPAVSKSLLKTMRREQHPFDRYLNVLDSFIRGKTDPWVTIDNPNTSETKKRKIRVRASTFFNKTRNSKPIEKSSYDEKSESTS